MQETSFYNEKTFKYSCLIIQSILCGVLIPFELYYIICKMRWKLDYSSYIILFAYTFSFVARLVICALTLEASSIAYDMLINILISVKAAFISGTLYYFVLEMIPVKIIIKSTSFEEYKLLIKHHKIRLRIVMSSLILIELLT